LIIPGKKRYLIVNADDFGLSPGVNHGVIKAHEQGIVTSASLMVRWPAAAEAAVYGRNHADLSLGLHIDLGEWIHRAYHWVPLYEVVSPEDHTALKDEVFRQLASFRDLLGRDPTHIDSHQHVHRREPTRSILVEMAKQLGIPIRQCTPHISYCGDFYGQTAEGFPLPDFISAEAILKILAALPPGLSELACHPAEHDDLETMYRRERIRELEVLCDPRVREALVALGIVLYSFSEALVLLEGNPGGDSWTLEKN
jgi:chitin disaccharide deacetylase